jgi:hypothetical protein
MEFPSHSDLLSRETLFNLLVSGSLYFNGVGSWYRSGVLHVEVGRALC